MLNEIPVFVLIPALGVALLASFFVMRAVRRAMAAPRKPGQPASVIPNMFSTESVSERLVSAERASEIEAERLLEKQEALLELEARKSRVHEVMDSAGTVAAKN